MSSVNSKLPFVSHLFPQGVTPTHFLPPLFPSPSFPVFCVCLFHPRSFYFIIIHFLFLFNIHKIRPARRGAALVLQLASQHNDAVPFIRES